MVLQSFWFCKFILWSLAKPRKCCLLFRGAFLSYWKLSGPEDEPCLWFLGDRSCRRTWVKEECTPAWLYRAHWENTPYGNLKLAGWSMYETVLLTKKLWNSLFFVTSHVIATCSLETLSIDFIEPVPYAAPFCIRHFWPLLTSILVLYRIKALVNLVIM